MEGGILGLERPGVAWAENAWHGKSHCKHYLTGALA